jgi:hypothetical protein
MLPTFQKDMDQLKLTERAHNFEATVAFSVKLSARSTVFSGNVSKTL